MSSEKSALRRPESHHHAINVNNEYSHHLLLYQKVIIIT